MALNLSVPKSVKAPPRTLIIGDPGVGKTFFGSKAPNVVVLKGEDGCPYLVPQVPEVGAFETKEHFLRTLDALAMENHDRKTVVVDCADLIVDLYGRDVLASNYKGNHKLFTQFAEGERVVQPMFREVLSKLDTLRTKRGMWVILLFHSGLIRASNVQGDDYQRVGGNTYARVWRDVLGWSDQSLHAAFVVGLGNAPSEQGKYAKKKPLAGGVKRVMYNHSHPGMDIKCRGASYHMEPKVCEFSYESYCELNKAWMEPLGFLSKGV